MSVLREVKELYSITEHTPSGRIGFAINDYLNSHKDELTSQEQEQLVFASDNEVINA